MSSDPRFTTWGTVKPKLEQELTSIANALVTARIEDVPALQARAQALMKVRDWFNAGSPDDKPIIGDDPAY